MSYLVSNKKIFGIVVGIVLAVITLSITVVAVVANTAGQAPEVPPSQQEESLPEEPEEELPQLEEPAVLPTSTQPLVFNNPSETRGVWLVPGVDFMTASGQSSTVVKAAIDAAIADAKSMAMNTIIVQTKLGDTVLYHSDYAAPAMSDFDVLGYIITKCRENELYVYATFDVLAMKQDGKMANAKQVDAVVMTNLYENAKSFAKKYSLDGVLLDSYYLQSGSTGSSYMSYLSTGGGMGFGNYMLSATESAMKAVVDAFKTANRSIQVGLLADAVWANKTSNELGSETAVAFQALANGYADTKKYIEDGYYDFIAVKAYGSRSDGAAAFSTVVKWWADLANKKEIPLYAVHASSKAVSNEKGWTSPSELTEQVMAAREIPGCKGSLFDSLSRLKANPQGSTDVLKKLFNEELDVQYFATKLEMAKPSQTTFTTYEPTVVFSGSSDPYFDALFNGEALTRDENGYFSIEKELKVGLNTFTFKHKDQTLTYNITRVVKVLESISPLGTMTVNGGTEVTISAMAYKDATVTANLGGKVVTLTKDTADDDTTDKDTNFVKFSGTFTMPAATASVQALGNINISASWSGVTDTLTGAKVTINKKVAISDGVLVQVTASQAETFPANTLDDNSMPDYFPLCKGSLDFVVGDELIYKEGSTTFTYYNLASGRRVYSSDIATVGGSLEDNVISGMQVESTNSHTYIRLKMSQHAAYTLKYSSSYITIDFHYTNGVPGDMTLNQNPLFSSATWSGSQLKLKLSGTFLGYTAYYESSTGYLVFECNNPPASMGSARIVIDPGHASTDPGALGFRSDYNEYEVNQGVSKYLKSQLESMGAYVYMNDVTRGRLELITRMNGGKSADPHLLICVHANSATTSSAAGSEAFYFNDYSKNLASKTSAAAASALDTNNRGAKFGRFYMTRDSAFPATLLETGFVSNQNEYYKLISTSYQKSIASNVASAIQSFLNSAGMGNVKTGTQSVGDMAGGTVAVTKVALDKSSATLQAGKTLQLTATITPANATSKILSWSSSATSVATVDENGLVTGLKAGTATITAESANGKKATCTVTVTGTASEVVTLNKSTLSLTKGATYQLTATLAGGGLGTFSWESDDEDIVTVSASGLLTAVKTGKATITVTGAGGGSATCTVTVTEQGTSSSSNSSSGSSTGEGSALEAKESDVYVQVGKSVTIDYVINPAGATVKNLKFSVGDTSLGSIDGEGKFTASGKAGEGCTITITATVNGKSVSATCEVHLTK